MEKYAEIKGSMKMDIEKFQQLQNAASSLRHFKLTDSALVAMANGKVFAMREESINQFNDLFKATVAADYRNIYETRAIQTGVTKGDVTVADRTVLPSPDKILYIQRHGNFELPKNLDEEERSFLEKLIDAQRGEKFNALAQLTWGVINYRKEQHMDLLKTFEKDFDRIFVKKGIKMDDILNTHWEEISNTNSVSITKYYADRVNSIGNAVCDVHTHTGNLMPSPADIYNAAGPHQQLDWSAILLVDLARKTPELPLSRVAVFHSDIVEDRWLGRVVDELSDARPPGSFEYPLVRDFSKYARARLTTWGELEKYCP
jgi:hypothetical protein